MDRRCGESVLRGANVFVPGVVAMSHMTKRGDTVEVWTDVDGVITKGSTKFHHGRAAEDTKGVNGDGDGYGRMFVGRGKVLLNREDLWPRGVVGGGVKVGVAIEMVERLYPNPAINGLFDGEVYAQNLPSMVVGKVLRIEKGMFVVDMCASPGGKSSHIAALLQNTGRVVAFDKSQKKVDELKRNMDKLNSHNVECYVQNSALYRKYVKEKNEMREVNEGKVWIDAESVDRVVVDPPCSALGIRPRLKIEIEDVKQLERAAIYQRTFLKAAVRLCKVGGLISYSTCTINPLENENNVQYVLDTFPQMKLVGQEVCRVGGCGLRNTKLSETNRKFVQRFDPSLRMNTAGFFIAVFEKCDHVPL